MAILAEWLLRLVLVAFVGWQAGEMIQEAARVHEARAVETPAVKRINKTVAWNKVHARRR